MDDPFQTMNDQKSSKPKIYTNQTGQVPVELLKSFTNFKLASHKLVQFDWSDLAGDHRSSPAMEELPTPPVFFRAQTNRRSRFFLKEPKNNIDHMLCFVHDTH